MSLAVTPGAHSIRRRRLYNLRAHPSLALGATLVALLLFAAIFPHALLPADPDAQDLFHVLAAPTLHHPFGTDAFGRDTFARVIAGARISLAEIVIAVSISLAIAVPLGIVVGTLGGICDAAAMWLMDLLFAFPGLVLAILVVAILGGGLFNTTLAIALFSIPVYARLARNLALDLRQAAYVEASVAMGASLVHVVFRHVLRNVATPILVQATLSAGTVVLAAASLSFLGLGVQPPSPEWGAMMSSGRNYLGADIYPSLFPGLAIALTVLGFDQLGEGLRNLLEPKR